MWKHRLEMHGDKTSLLIGFLGAWWVHPRNGSPRVCQLLHVLFELLHDSRKCIALRSSSANKIGKVRNSRAHIPARVAKHMDDAIENWNVSGNSWEIHGFCYQVVGGNETRDDRERIDPYGTRWIVQ